MKVPTRLALGLVLLAALSGCSGKRVNISGTITRDGKPLEWKSEEGHLLVIFVPEDRKSNGQVYSATTDRATGTYRISELRAGRYLVAIHQFGYRHKDALGNKFDPSNSPLRYDVLEDNQVIDIDLPKDLP